MSLPPGLAAALTAEQQFSPLLLPNCILWLRADTGIALTAGLVSAWTDLSLGTVYSQATAANQPTLLPQHPSFGGQPVLNFGGNQWVTGTRAGSGATAQPITAYAVFSSTNTGNVQSVLGGTTAGRYPIGVSTANQVSTSLASQVASPATAGSPVVACCTDNGANSVIYVNDSQHASATGNAGSSSLALMLTMGAANAGASNQLTGNIAEVLMYVGAHDGNARRLVMQYLGCRYGIGAS